MASRTRPPLAAQSTRRLLHAAVVLTLVVAAVLMAAPAAARSPDTVSASAEGPDEAAATWSWPVRGFRIVAAYQAPAHDYGPGHRGIDLQPTASSEVRAPRSGVVAFAGRIADRGILTIDHGDGYVTTLEPVDTTLHAGTRVEGGVVVGSIALGGHAAAGTVHFGVRLNGEYVNPLLLFGGVPRAVLLPCCD